MTRTQTKQSQPIPSIKQIRQAIPKHCFERSIPRSMLYVIRDIFLLLLIGYLATIFVGFEITLLTVPFWIFYAYVQGTIGFGVFVLGHQCGHGAFSDYKLLNDIVGYVLHSVLLVPYFSWQRSHAVHHSKNNHLLDNQSHQPSYIKKSRQQYQTTYRLFGANGFVLIEIMIHSTIGWIIYLFFHGSGSRRNPFTKEQYKSIPNHFSPFESNQLFPKELRLKVFLSTVGNVIFIAALIYLSSQYGLWPVTLLYGGPYAVTFAWLVVVTWLQHTEPTVPHFGQDQWNWLRGALMTIDRNYPWIVDHAQHRIGTTHVCHHIFPQIPHYHAVEATKAIIPVLGKHYKYDPTPITKVIWRLSNKCHYIESLEGVQYYKSFTQLKQNEKEKAK